VIKEYFLGLDIGSNSVGYAVTDTNYDVLKFNNKAMWGVHIFDEGKQASERRVFRSARRRLQRRKQRILLARELFAKEIAKVDKDFFTRLDQSSLKEEDKTIEGIYSLFNDINMTDKDYHKKFPTIHHLIMHLINTSKKEDIRLIYLAVSYMLAHRGHFLIDVDSDDINKVVSFDVVYDSFRNYFIENEIESNWTEDIKSGLADILQQKIGINDKSRKVKELVFGRSKISKREDAIIKGICGRKFKLSDLFDNEEYTELENNSITLSDENLQDKLMALRNMIDEHELELITRMKAIYDWS